jgi:hypothetical protein
MRVSGPRKDWRAPAACRISSSAKLHFARPHEARSCTLRVFGASLVRAASLDVVDVCAVYQKKFGGSFVMYNWIGRWSGVKLFR